jgi:hypothetical protein
MKTIEKEDLCLVIEDNKNKFIDKILRELSANNIFNKLLILLDYAVLILFNLFNTLKLNFNKFNTKITINHVTSNVNSEDFINWINSKDNAIVFNFGTSIYKNETLLKINHEILNIHTGILPAYRNVYSEFWALSNMDFSNIGTTIFKIDSRVDMGAIIDRQYLNDTYVLNNSYSTVINSNLVLASEMITKLINSGEIKVNRNYNEESGYYKTPTAKEILRFFLYNLTR